MRLGIPVLVAIVTLLALSGCNPFDHDANSPEPVTLAHHFHPMVVHIRTIHQSTDTLGFVSLLDDHSLFLCSRAYDKRLTRKETDIGSFDVLHLIYDDTAVHVCSTNIAHFVGYQNRYGGDTTQFSTLDRYEGWELSLWLVTSEAVRRNGDTVSVYAGILRGLPDTVRASGKLEWDMTVDLDSLILWDSSASKYTMQADRVSIRQR